LSWWLLSK